MAYNQLLEKESKPSYIMGGKNVACTSERLNATNRSIPPTGIEQVRVQWKQDTVTWPDMARYSANELHDQHTQHIQRCLFSHVHVFRGLRLSYDYTQIYAGRLTIALCKDCNRAFGFHTTCSSPPFPMGNG
jgi:hypothetical protein